MRALFPQFRFTQEYDKAIMLQYIHMFLCFFALFMEYLSGVRSFSLFSIFKIIFMATGYRFMFIALKELYYTFWTLLLIFFCYFLLESYSYNSISQPYTLLYTLCGIVLAIEAYIMSSPIFYPRLKWWEYDFRIRDDIKIRASLNEKEVNGRLTDLRREAGCIVLFQEVTIGEKISFKTEFLDEDILFETEVVSKRETCPGRGISYGVKFLFDSEEDKRLYHRFRRFWKVKSRGRIRRKFKKEVENE